MKIMKIKYVRVLLVIFFVVVCYACAGVDVKIKEDTSYDQPIAHHFSEYLIGPGDVFEIFYTFGVTPTTEPYRLGISDVIRVEFSYHENLNRDLTLQPDGKIILPKKGELDAAGLTPIELNQNITKVYSDTFQNPEVTVTLLKFNQPTRHFQEAIRSDNRGQARQIKVRPDGYISFPLIEDIKATGLTIPQLRQVVAEKYLESVKNVSISLTLEAANSNLVYVLGEVSKPDYYRMDTPTTVSQILSRAGINTETAELSTILVITRSKDNKPVGRIFNFEEVIAHANIGNDFLLDQYDVVYVPKNKINKANVFVEQYINRIVPNFFRVGIGINYRIID